MASPEALEAFSRRYLRYKADTDLCLSWLLDTALAAGYRLPSAPIPTVSISAENPQQRVETPYQQDPPPQTLAEKLRMKQKLKTEKRKEKAREKEKEKESAVTRSTDIVPTKHIVRTKEIAQQAKVLVNARSKAKMPIYIFNAWTRAVGARKRVAARYESARADRVSNSKHQHFIRLLESVLQTLKPTTLPSSKSRKQQDATIVNRFEMLSVEDTEDDFEDPEPLSTPKPDPVPAYDFQYEDSLEDSFSSEETQFEIMCFFEDCHDTQDFLNGTWQSYKNRELDLETAAFLTSAAIALIKEQEKELLQHIGVGLEPAQFLLAQSVSAIPQEIGWPYFQITPLDDFVYSRTSAFLVKCITGSYMRVPGGSHTYFAVNTGKPLFPTQEQQSLLESPAVKKAEDDDRFLTQVMMDLIFAEQIKREVGRFPWKPDERRPGMAMLLEDTDEFTQGFSEYLLGGTNRYGHPPAPSTWLCFAAQIMLDVRELLGENFGVHAQFEEKLTLIHEGSSQPKVGSENEIWQRWMETKEILSHWRLVESSLKRPFEKFKAAMLKHTNVEKEIAAIGPSWEEIQNEATERGETMGDFINRRKKQAILPSTELNLLASIPLSCGLRILRLNVAWDSACRARANMTGSIFFLSHTYNALRQLGILKKSWPQMDLCISINIVALFSGEVPKTPIQLLMRFMIAVGFKPSEMRALLRLEERRNRGQRSKVAYSDREGCRLLDTKASAILRDFCTPDSSMNIHQCLRQLQVLFQPKSAKPNHQQSDMSSIGLLKLLRSSLPATIQNLQFDYLALARTCDDMLERIRLTILCELGIDHFESTESSLEDPFEKRPPGGLFWKRGYFEMVQYMLWEAQSSRHESPQMQVAGKIMDKHIADIGQI